MVRLPLSRPDVKFELDMKSSPKITAPAARAPAPSPMPKPGAGADPLLCPGPAWLEGGRFMYVCGADPVDGNNVGRKPALEGGGGGGGV